MEAACLLYLHAYPRNDTPKAPAWTTEPTEAALSLTKFGIGQPVRRSEDPTLVRGEGRYTDDINLPGQAYAVMVRSRDAHGVIRGIDTAAAKAMPGRARGAHRRGPDRLMAGSNALLPLKSRDGSPIHYTPRPALADRQSALRRRSGRLRRRRDRSRKPRTRPKRSRSTSSRCRR